MTIMQQEIYEIKGLDGRRLCWNCGKREPRLDGKWCSPNCETLGRHLVLDAPCPSEISEITAGIRLMWSEEERLRRKLKLNF